LLRLNIGQGQQRRKREVPREEFLFRSGTLRVMRSRETRRQNNPEGKDFQKGRGWPRRKSVRN